MYLLPLLNHPPDDELLLLPEFDVPCDAPESELLLLLEELLTVPDVGLLDELVLSPLELPAESELILLS